MSSNNQIVILKKKKEFQVHEDPCVDNKFKPTKLTELKTFSNLEEAIQFANNYIKESLVEYGICFLGLEKNNKKGGRKYRTAKPSGYIKCVFCGKLIDKKEQIVGRMNG